MSDQRVGRIILGAAVGGLIGLWFFGVLGGIAGAIVGAIVLAVLDDRTPA